MVDTMPPPALRLNQGVGEAVSPDLGDIEVILDGENVVPHIDKATGATTIENPDGTVEVNFDPATPDKKSKSKDWDANLAEEIDEGDVANIGAKLIEAIDDDIRSRGDWLSARASGIDQLGLRPETPGAAPQSSAPVEGQSTVRHPLMLEAVLRFQANARGELLASDGPVKVKAAAGDSQVADDDAAQLEIAMNYWFTDVALEYYPDTDKMLFWVGFGGSGFKKLYHHPIKRRPVSESVDADDIIIPNTALSLETAGRVTHRIRMLPSVLKRMQLCGAYRDIELQAPTPISDNEVKEKKMQTEGVDAATAYREEDQEREIYEVYTEIDLKGYEHKEKGKLTGLPLPYKISVDKDSMKVLEIRRNWREDDETYRAKDVFVEYVFIPGLGFYGIGLLHVLGGTTKAATAAWRILLDAGMFSNFPGGLIKKTGNRQDTNEMRVPPGSFRPVDVPGNAPIQQSIMPLPYKEPSAALMTLGQNIVETGQRVGGTAELQIGEGKQDMPVGTTLALIEQATKTMSAVHKRLHAAQAREFKAMRELFLEDTEAFLKHMPATFNKPKILEALKSMSLVPKADPNTSSQTERIMKAVAVKQLEMQNPQLYDPMAVDSRILASIGWVDYQALFNKNPQPPAPPPVDPARMLTAQASMVTAQSKAKQVQEEGPIRQLELQQEQRDGQAKMATAQIGVEKAKLDIQKTKQEGVIAAQEHQHNMQMNQQEQVSGQQEMQRDQQMHEQQMAHTSQQHQQQLEQGGEVHEQQLQHGDQAHEQQMASSEQQMAADQEMQKVKVQQAKQPKPAAKPARAKGGRVKEHPPMKGARKAHDGHWYVEKAHAKGKYQRVIPDEA